MEAKPAADDDGVLAAKQRLAQLIRGFDPLDPLRQRPLLTVAVAGAAGAMLAMNTEKLIGAASFTRALTSLARIAGGFLTKPTEPPKPNQS